MFDQLLQFDYDTFIFINQGLANVVFDFLMPLIRNKYFWSPLYLFLLVYLIINYKMQSLIVIGGIILTIVLADQISSNLIKHAVERLRPCNDPFFSDNVRLLLNSCGSGYSFTSSHAPNHFALSTFLFSVFSSKAKWIAPAVYIWAILVAFAQVYVGVHFPLDVLSGALVGTIIGAITALTVKKLGRFRA